MYEFEDNALFTFFIDNRSWDSGDPLYNPNTYHDLWLEFSLIETQLDLGAEIKST